MNGSDPIFLFSWGRVPFQCIRFLWNRDVISSALQLMVVAYAHSAVPIELHHCMFLLFSTFISVGNDNVIIIIKDVAFMS